MCSGVPDGVSGECFLVERYESDVEEGCEEGDQILLTLSDRFLEEKDTNGVVSTWLLIIHVHVFVLVMCFYVLHVQY